MSVSSAGRRRARTRIACGGLAVALLATAGLLVTATPGAGAASPGRRRDALAALAAAWQRARTGVALARFGLSGARDRLADLDATVADLARQQDAVRAARRIDPAGDPGGPDALASTVALAALAHDRAAAVAHDGSVALFTAFSNASLLEGLVAHEVARRGHIDEVTLRADWDRSPAHAVDAMVFALAQAGKPYVFAASGPGAYDCSGLTMAAWRTVGVRLTHFAATQYRETARVASKDLAPGDLVFFGADLGHVGLYLGGHVMVHAPHPGDVVRVATIDRRGDVRTGRVRG